MPFIQKSTYRPTSFTYKNAHLSTIIPAKFKHYPIPDYKREKLELEDGDFLNLDWRVQPVGKQLIIISHGLEGDSKKTYANSCSDYFYEKGYAILAWNYRSCGGEMNRLPRLYHHGMTDDLHIVIQYAISKGFEDISLIGFSMGGALSLNYLGSLVVPKEIKSAVCISAPLCLASSSETLKKFPNTVYLKNFMRTLVPKLKEKAEQFPGKLNTEKLNQIKSFDEVDAYFTAPLHGYKDKAEYYQLASPLYCIDKVSIPTLVLNAMNDPFLGDDCYPTAELKQHEYIYFETPRYGGHCGFPLEKEKHSWAEVRAYEFIIQNKKNI